MQPVLKRLVADLQRAADLVADIKTLRKPLPGGGQTPPGHPGLPQFQMNLVRELAFLRCVLAWEVFLEDSFVVYLTGGVGLSKKGSKAHVTAKTATQARGVLLGGNPFLSWAGNAAKERAKIWFKDGEPYVAAFQAFPSKEVRVIRNRIAHDSGTAQEEFEKLRNKLVKKPNERKGMGAGGLLSRATKAHPSRFDSYVSDMNAAATTIATN